MVRPTAMIRELLLLQLMEETIQKALLEARRELADAEVKMLSTQDDGYSIYVEYKVSEYHDEGIYMKKMLDAEARGYLKRLPNLKRHREEK